MKEFLHIGIENVVSVFADKGNLILALFEVPPALVKMA